MQTVRKYLGEHRNTLGNASAAICAFYAVRRYITDRVEDVKERLEQEQQARNK
jgi:hypothetical protein